jgi:flavorubredoxin
MTSSFEAIKITDRVYWVGAIDWELRNFHGYRTSRGTSYNAYLILADEITLIDTVRAPFFDEMLARIRSVVDPSKIRHVISTHAEMDHSGCLAPLLEVAKSASVVASDQGKKALAHHLHWDREVRVMADGERMSLGNVTLRFIEARMLHWPDSMFAYLEEEGLLFSNDAFGMHLASSARFADELDAGVCDREASKYFANILLPFCGQLSKLLEGIGKMDLDLRLIAPDHGPVWRHEPQQIIERYARWASRPPSAKAVVVFDSMWQSTDKMARAVADGLTHGGLQVEVMPLKAAHRSDVATELLEAGALLVGSPTLNNQMYPTMAGLMSYLKGLRPKGLIGAAFGSYGWGGQGVSQLDKALDDMGVERVEKGLRVRYVPDTDALASCHALGERVAATLKEKLA